MNNDFWLHIKLFHPDAKPPKRNSEHAAGYDLYAIGPAELEPGTLSKIRLGFGAAFTPGWGAQIWDRSGLGSKGLIRHSGLIDADYRGEWCVLLFNHSENSFFIEPGDRIAQAVFVQVGQAEAVVVDNLIESQRGEGGFGSTGR